MANQSTLASASCPAGNLPDEIVDMIFKVAYDNETFLCSPLDQDNAHAQSAVCRQWRRVLGQQTRFSVSHPHQIARLCRVLGERRAAGGRHAAVLDVDLSHLGVRTRREVAAPLSELLRGSAGLTELRLALPVYIDAGGIDGREWFEDDELVKAIGQLSKLETLVISQKGSIDAAVLSGMLRGLPNLTVLDAPRLYVQYDHGGNFRALRADLALHRRPGRLTKIALGEIDLGGLDLLACLATASSATLTHLDVTWDERDIDHQAVHSVARPLLDHLRYVNLSCTDWDDPAASIVALLPRLGATRTLVLSHDDVHQLHERGGVVPWPASLDTIEFRPFRCPMAFGQRDTGTCAKALVDVLGAGSRVGVVVRGAHEMAPRAQAAVAAHARRKGVPVTFSAP